MWALATGGRLGVGNDPRYNKTRCFETFPFPDATAAQQERIRELGERLDAHRKRQQSLHPQLTLTDCYNVLEKLRAHDAACRAGAPPAAATATGAVALQPAALPPATLTAKERAIHEHGLVSVLRQLHDELDAAVAAAYGLAPDASDDAILAHLCALNARRAAEERAGHIRWLRPAFQNPASTATQTTLATGGSPEPATPAPVKPAARLPWPPSLAGQAQAIRAALAAPTDAATLSKSFKGAKADRVGDILETLASLGQARLLPDGRFVAA